MTLEQALAGSPAPVEILATQTLLSVPFVDFAGETQVGQLVVHRDLAAEIAELFRLLLVERFPIGGMIPVVAFDWSDDLSMEANNCSAFNYRVKVGKNELSAHATGRALDINPRQNPYIRGELVLPEGAQYDLEMPGTLTPESTAVTFLEHCGWIWGGRWTTLKDFHHFEKPAGDSKPS
ncbi:M15 family peptidase [bacterium]|nr:MAG: M15 family peptidase [bacterium]